MALPTVMTINGLQPQTPSSLHAQIISGAVALDPGLTANLPGTLIEDIASTDTAALVLIDQARVETVNSVTPYGANLFLLNQLGQIYGIQQGLGSNTSVYVTFTGTAGYVIPKGVIVSDGTYQYVTQDAVIVGSLGTVTNVYCVATLSGSWGVGANTVTTIVSSVPSGVTLSVTNPAAGVPSTANQTPEQYRAQVLAAGTIGCTGLGAAIRTYVQRVPGVVDNKVSVIQDTSKFKVLVVGGDTYAVANAIYQSVGDPNILEGATAGGTTVTVSVVDTPNTYSITYVQPVAERVRVNVYWNTTSTNIVSNAAMQSACNQPITDYINSLGPGQPINNYEIEFLFQTSTATILPTALISYIQPIISIYDGSSWNIKAPESGTGLVYGTVGESYWVPDTISTTKGTAP